MTHGDPTTALDLLKKNGTPLGCTECGGTPVELRLRDNQFPYGKSPSGRALDAAEFAVQLVVELEEPDHEDNRLPLDQLCGFCKLHWEMRNSSGPDELGDSGAGPSHNQLVATAKRRAEVVEVLGSRCVACGSGRSLAVVLKAEFPRDWWAQQGLKSWSEKFEHLQSSEDAVAAVELKCAPCSASHVSGLSTQSKQNLRQRLVDGYGRMCGVCCSEVDWRTAWLVRLPGTAMLKWPESGRKLTSRQKYQKLLADGCPSGWELRCPGCSSDSQDN